MNKNIPNILTCIRVILIPFFVYFLMYTELKYVALGVFIVASLTDFLDGHLARKYQLVSNFGKFMDPLADKLLVCTALICFTELKLLPSWMVIIIISREFIISGFRLLAVEQGVVIAANYWGKIKTNCQMIMIVLLIGQFPGTVFDILEQIFIWAALIMTVVSLITYLYQNKQVLK
ncbi:CDP-diacylglycerol--glycerol-3-phosphate 3-phosphatidyltransferase [Lachnospiraceae bacterium TWA4]|nr:CDP-diacylglycerol--glycerol-3-phosphate 3-phosphatidyltransferase [Lachnospiraceae bacterium TWA4]